MIRNFVLTAVTLSGWLVVALLLVPQAEGRRKGGSCDKELSAQSSKCDVEIKRLTADLRSLDSKTSARIVELDQRAREAEKKASAANQQLNACLNHLQKVSSSRR